MDTACSFHQSVLEIFISSISNLQNVYIKSNQRNQDSSGNQNNAIKGQTPDTENIQTQQEHKVTKVIHTM